MAEIITPDIVLECRQVSKTFTRKMGGETAVLTDVTFAAHRGDLTVITGRSGAGKSTLLSLLAGLDRPQRGSILLEEQSLDHLTNAQLAALRRERVGMIFQNFNLLPSWTAFENVEAAVLLSTLSPTERRDKIIALLESLGLGAYLDHLPAELSIGQQQRVAIARTLINEPSLILADEPTGGVDPETAEEIIAVLLAPVREGRATMIVTTHGNFPLEAADHIYDLCNGVLVKRESAVTC
ncbi:MAG: ABC transporter ATP-binding protein [Armatimonadota bacterium]